MYIFLETQIILWHFSFSLWIFRDPAMGICRSQLTELKMLQRTFDWYYRLVCATILEVGKITCEASYKYNSTETPVCCAIQTSVQITSTYTKKSSFWIEQTSAMTLCIDVQIGHICNNDGSLVRARVVLAVRIGTPLSARAHGISPTLACMWNCPNVCCANQTLSKITSTHTKEEFSFGLNKPVQ